MSSLRERLDAVKRESRRGTSGGKFLFATPSNEGGSDSAAALMHCVTGTELIWVKHPEYICGGRIGSGVKGCLKSIGQCDTESHERSKCELPTIPFLIPMANSSPVKGHSNVTLPTENLDPDLITSLLEKTEVNWAKEFEVIKSNGTKSVQEEIISKEIVHTSRKQTSFQTPMKKTVILDLDDRLHDLKSITDLVDELGDETEDEEGNRKNRNLHLVKDENTVLNLNDIFSQLDILCEHARIVKDVIGGNSDVIEGFVKPLESVLAGVRLEMASVRGDIGLKNLSHTNVPPGLWNAVETGFSSISTLEKQVSDCKLRSDEAYEVAEYMLGNPSKKETSSSVPSSDNSGDKDEGKDFIKKLGLSETRSIKDGVYNPRAKKPGDETPPPSNNSGDCDNDKMKCSLCMNRMDGIESRLVNSLLRISNLEEAKSGSIESAILVRNEVFRGRRDIAAWCQKQFPLEKEKNIECACFSTPHYILNMMYADMCSKRYASIDLQAKDFKNLGVNRPDATACYALQTDRPDFMVASIHCPSHVLKVSKQVRDSAPIKFIPSYADFGTSSDGESMQYRFKKSLEHIKSRQEKYVESRLEEHPNREVITIAMQLLNDSCKFISQMLDFMEELYSACQQSFGASTEAWELVCHCIDELFTKELKPSLKFCVSPDLSESRNAFIGALHVSFSLNVKLRELTQVGLKNHHSTTTSHVRFVMKMAKNQRKGGDDKLAPLQAKFDKLQLEHNKMKEAHEKDQVSLLKTLKNLESRLDKVKDAQVKALASNKA